MQLFEKPNTIGYYIFQELQKGPQVISDIIPIIKKAKVKASKQAIYTKIRNMKNKGIVVVHKGVISFNYKWLRNVNRFIQIAQFNYIHTDDYAHNFNNLHEGEKIKYTFSNLKDLCRFWYHSLYILLKMHKNQETFYAYDPHTWFYYAWPQDEADLVTIARESEHKFYQMVAKDHALDKKAGESADQVGYFYQAGPEPLYEKPSYHFSTIGDFVIEVKLDKELGEKIRKLYRQEKSASEKSIKKIIDLVNGNKAKSNIIISRKAKKATRLANMISKKFK